MHRGLAAPRQAPRAQDVLRLCRLGQLQREHLPRQRSRLRWDQAAPAGRDRFLAAVAQERDDRPRSGDAARARADGAHRHAMGERRDSRGARGGEGRRALHALDDEHLIDRGRRRGEPRALLVSALRDARPRFRATSHRPRQGRQMLGAGADARSPDPRPAPQGRAQRPLGSAQAHGLDPARPVHEAALVPGCLAPRGASSATSSGMSGAWKT